MFSQLCLLALLAVSCGHTPYTVLRGHQLWSYFNGRVERLRPPYSLTIIFGKPGPSFYYPVDVATTILEDDCDYSFDLALFGCSYPIYVNITVRDWKPVRDIVVPIDGLYREIDVHRSYPCSGDSLVEIHAICYRR